MKPKKSFPSESEEDDQTAGPETIMAFDSSDDEDAGINSSFIGISYHLYSLFILEIKLVSECNIFDIEINEPTYGKVNNRPLSTCWHYKC